MKKPGEIIMDAVRKQAEGVVAVHLANIKVYQTMPAGIGEHSDIVESIEKEVDMIAAAEDKIEAIIKHFK